MAAAERHLNDLIDWCFDPGNDLDAGARAAADAFVRKTIRDALDIERNLLLRVDFAALTGRPQRAG